MNCDDCGRDLDTYPTLDIHYPHEPGCTAEPGEPCACDLVVCADHCPDCASNR